MLAISDLVYLIINTVGTELIPSVISRSSWLYYCLATVHLTTVFLEQLLVLSFSTERLIAISCPLQVRCNLYVYRL